jgi:hypothetical protein
MATAVCRGNTDGIAQCGISRATLEATGCCHRATTHSVSPQWSPGQQANKQQSTNTPTLLAILMAMAMRRYVTACITQWRRSRAIGQVLCPLTQKQHGYTGFFDVFHRQNRRKRLQVNDKAPVLNRGMTYQTKEKGLTKSI